MKTRNRKWALNPEQQVLITVALRHFFRVCDEVDDVDVVEYQALKRLACRTQTYDEELIDYATESGGDWRAPGRLEQVRRLRDQDAHSALSRRINHGGGNPPRYDKEGIREDVRQRREADPELDWLAVTAAVAADVERKDGDTFAKVRRRVRDYCHDMRWPSKRKGHVAAT